MSDLDSGAMGLDHPRAKKKLSFDPTINAGHILTFISMLAVLFIGWSTMDKRVTVLEEAKSYQRERDSAQDATITDKLGDLKRDVRELKSSIDQLREQQSGRARP